MMPTPRISLLGCIGQSSPSDRTISLNTRKEDVIQNMSDFTLLVTDNNTLSDAEESSSYRRRLETTSNLQVERQSGKQHEAEVARNQETSDLMSTGSAEENFSLETLLAQLPPVPSFLPDESKDGGTCTTTKVPKRFSVHCAASGGPSLWRESNKWNIGLTNLPSKCAPGEEKLTWPLEVCYIVNIKRSQIRRYEC